MIKSNNVSKFKPLTGRMFDCDPVSDPLVYLGQIDRIP